MSGFPDEVRSHLAARSGGNCEAQLEGCHGQGCHAHHRKLRQHGDHSAANGLWVCSACHVPKIHNLGKPMYQRGLLLHHCDDPAEMKAWNPERGWWQPC